MHSRSHHRRCSERRQSITCLIVNTFMELRGIIRTVKCPIESRTQEPLNDDRLSCHGWWSMPDASCPGVKKVVTGRHHVRDFMVGNRRRNSSRFGEKVLARKNHHRSDEQEEPQISIRSLARNAKQQCRVFHRERRRCVQSSQKQLTMGLGFRGE